MNIKMDYSFLFSGLNSSAGSGSFAASSFLSDYASIKNGSYLKLMKAYYAEVDTDKKTSSASSTILKNGTATSTDSAKTLAAIEKDADALKESADTLLAKGSKSLFQEKDITTKAEDGTETTVKGYDKDAIYKGVKSFADNYNALLKSAGSANSTSITKQAQNMAYAVQTNSNLLSKAGITVGTDGALSVDEEKLKSADISTLKTLFNGNGSLAYRVSANASMIDYTAEREAEKANTYNASGSYNSNYSSGNIFTDYF